MSIAFYIERGHVGLQKGSMKKRTLDRHPWPENYASEYEELIKLSPSIKALIHTLPVEGALANAAYVLKSLTVSDIEPDFIAPMAEGGIEIAWVRPTWKAKIECSNEGTIIFTREVNEQPPQVIDYSDYKLSIGSWETISRRLVPAPERLPAVA